jgi:hypothetical protein
LFGEIRSKILAVSHLREFEKQAAAEFNAQARSRDDWFYCFLKDG